MEREPSSDSDSTGLSKVTEKLNLAEVAAVATLRPHPTRRPPSLPRRYPLSRMKNLKEWSGNVAFLAALEALALAVLPGLILPLPLPLPLANSSTLRPRRTVRMMKTRTRRMAWTWRSPRRPVPLRLCALAHFLSFLFLPLSLLSFAFFDFFFLITSLKCDYRGMPSFPTSPFLSF